MIQQQQTYFLEFYRAGLRAATDIMKASFENAEKLHTQQIEALRGAIDENARSARELSEAKSMDEMLTLQAGIARSQLERTADFWTRLWRATGETQVALIGQVQNQVGQLASRSAENTARFSPPMEVRKEPQHHAPQRKSA